MPHVVVSARRETLQRHRALLATAITNTMIATIDSAPDKIVQRFIAFDPDDIVAPVDRGADYTLIEITMLAGRSDEVKRGLITDLFARIAAEVGIAPSSVEIVILDIPATNWGVRGAVVADQ